MTLSKRQSNWMTELQKLGASPIMYWRDVQFSVKREAESVLTKVEVEGRDLSPGEQRWIEGSHADLTFIDTKIQEQEVILEKERQEAASHATGPLSAYPEGQTIIHGVSPTDLDDNARMAHLRMLQRKPFAGRAYQEMFGHPTAQGAFSSFNEFAATVYNGIYHPGLIRAGMTEDRTSAGGFLVPEEHVAMMLDKSLENEIVRSRAQVVPMTTDTKKVGGFSNKDNSGSAPFGGLSLQWISEAGSFTLKEAKTRMIILTAHKGGILVNVSNELLEDGTTFEEVLTNAIISGVGWGMDDAFLNGSGAGKPLSILGAASLIVVAKETGQLASTIQYENLTKMYSRMHPACISNAVWIANVTAVPELLGVNIPIGTGGTFLPALKEESGEFRLLGKPVLFTEKVPALGSQGDLLFVDISQYIIGLRKEITIDRSGHVGFQTDETYFRCIVRVDGQPAWDSVFTPKNGSTLSWAVTLAART